MNELPFFTKTGKLKKQKREKIGKFVEELIKHYLEIKYPNSKVYKSKSGTDFIVKGQGLWIEVKWQDFGKRNITIYSKTFEKHLKSKWFFKRYYIYLVYDRESPKLKIIPPNRIDVNIIKKLMKIKRGKYWWNIDIILSPRIHKDIKPINLFNWFKENEKFRK